MPGRVAAELRAELEGLLARHTAVTSSGVTADTTADDDDAHHHTSPRITAAAAAVEAEVSCCYRYCCYMMTPLHKQNLCACIASAAVPDPYCMCLRI
jgi:hypothetical protein